MSTKIKDSITWVGKVDWELRKFHGEEYSTHRGSTYNAYLVRDEKAVLIDTVWTPHAAEFVRNLGNELDLKEISAILALHAEPDHSGALPYLLREIPGTPVYCTANGEKSLRGHYHQDWNFRVVKTGDRLNIGSKEFVFIEAPMLHWPDQLFAYLTGDEVLFSSDAFGQHFATGLLFNDLVDQAELYQEAIKYYANILAPFSALVDRKVKEVLAMGLALDTICPSHGVVWRQDPAQIAKKYVEWANDYRENQVSIIYDTMYNATRRMAEGIAEGIMQADSSIAVKLFNSARSDKNDVIVEVFKSKGVLAGSCTVNRAILSSVAGILEEIRGLALKKKKAAAFGTYGWSGEMTKIISDKLREGGFEVLNEGIRVQWAPDAAAMAECMKFGRDFAAALR